MAKFTLLEDESVQAPKFVLLDEPGEWAGSSGNANTRSGVALDAIKSIPGAIPRASAGLVGLPSTILEFIARGVEKVGGLPTGGLSPTLPNIGDLVTKGYDSISELVTGKPVYKPQTGPGRVVDMMTQTAVSGPGSLLQKLTMGGGAAITGEAARAVGITNPIALGALQMLGATTASLPWILRNVPAANINEAIKNISAQDLAKAQSLMDDAARMGSPITGAEAIAQVTGRNSLQDIQRVVEASRQGGPITQTMMNQRPQTARVAFEAAADQIAPPPANPAQTPTRLQLAAEQSINRARQSGNAAASPSYAAAEQQRISSADWNALTQQPAAMKALSAVKQATEWGVTNEREGSIRWIDAAKRWIDAKLQSQNTTAAEARVWKQGLDDLVSVADRASPDYRQARAIVAQNQRTVVDPMRRSPIGNIAENTKGLPAEQAMRAQSEILMPQAPRALDPKAIRRTVTAISSQDKTAARDWARQNIQAIFDESAQNLSSGQNQWGGAKFASQIAGNPRQKENLHALVDSVSGAQTWRGFERLLEVLEAQGKRQAPGSQTAFNQQIQSQLSAGGGGTPLVSAASPQKAMGLIGNWYDNFRFGKNTEEMARILTDPRSVEKMKLLAREAPSSARAAALTASILSAQQPGLLVPQNTPNR